MCPFGEMYEILNFLHGENLFTHQLPRAMRDAEPWLEESLPFLAEVTLRDVTPENYKDVLLRCETAFGALHSIEPIPRTEELRRHPITELEEMVGKDRVIVIDTDEE